jgi:hypothetical protein
VGVRRPELELGRLEIEDRRKGVFTLAVLLGDPTANIPFDHVFRMPEPWAESSGHTSFSEMAARQALLR